MGSINERLIKLQSCYKYDEEILNKLKNFEIKNLKDIKQRKKLRKILFKIRKLFKPCISNDTIISFYENPEEFFNSYEELIEKTSFYDELGNSIFIHYFYILYDLYKKNEINSDNIYQKNFNNFFTKEAKYLSMQDFALETPLHKLAKFIDKKFFFFICKKLKEINVLSEDLLLINNMDERSCFSYILQEVKDNKNKIIQTDFELYKEFFNYYPNLIKSISKEEQKLLVIFSSLITFDDQKFGKVNFNDAIQAIYNLIEKNSDILNIFQFLYYPTSSGMNYLNSLYHLCKECTDFDKLFQLILDLSNIKMINDESYSKLCLSNHISYVLGKMNSTKAKGNNEINYGMRLINQIIPTLIKDESNENVMNIIFVRKKNLKDKNMLLNKNRGIFKYLTDNSNLTFEQKSDIINNIKAKFGNYFDEYFDKDFWYLYQLLDAINKNEINDSNISDKFNKNIFVQKIFVDFYFIGDLYREVYQALKKYEEIDINKYILLLSEYIINNCQNIFDNYRLRYNLQKKYVQIIMNLIISYEKQNYSNNIEDEYISKNFFNIKIKNQNQNRLYLLSLYQEFMISKSELTMILLKNYDKDDISDKNYGRKKAEFYYAFFSFNYDYETVFNDPKIIENIRDFLSKNKRTIFTTEVKDYVFPFYKFVLKNLYIGDIFAIEISKFNILMRRYLNKLLYHWEEESDFSDLVKYIKDYIPIFCFIFLRKKDNIQETEDKINFFFKEFIKALEPSFENKFDIYYQQALSYIDHKDEAKFYLKSPEKELLLPKNYLALILIFVRVKFGKFNPQLFFLFIYKYKKYINFIYCNFISNYLENHFGKESLYHYFFVQNQLISKDDYKIQLKNIDYPYIYSYENYSINNHTILFEYMTKFFSHYLYKLNGMKNSLIFYYIQKILEKYIEIIKEEEGQNKSSDKDDENDKSDEKNEKIFDIEKNIFCFKPEIYKSFIFEISKEQNENIYNLIKSLFFNNTEWDIPLYSFLEIKLEKINKEKIFHNINILKQLSLDLKPKTDNIKGDNIKEYLNNQKADDNTLLNLYRVLFVLKEKNDSLLNCVKTNKFLIMYVFHFLLKNYFFCLVKLFKKEKKDKNDQILLDKQYNYIFDELVNFTNFYNTNENNFYEKNDELSISKCFIYLVEGENFNFQIIFTKLKLCLKDIYAKIFYNRKIINLEDLISILNKDIFALISIAFAYFSYFNNHIVKEKLNLVDYDEIRNIIYFFFNHLLLSINPELQKKYKVFNNIFDELITIESNLNKSQKSIFFDENDDFSFKLRILNNPYDLCFVLIYIYLTKTYPSYNPNMLLHIYKLHEKEFFKKLIKCLSCEKNKNSLEKHLFIEKKDNIDIKYILANFREFDKKYISEKMILYLCKYLIDLNYSENSFVYEYIQENLNNEEISKNCIFLNNLIFNYNPPETTDIQSLNLYNQMLQIFSANFTFYGFLNENEELNNNNTERMIKKIKIVENLIQYSSSNEINMNNSKKNYSCDYLRKENFCNLYCFLSTLKSKNKKIISIANNNIHFLKETINIFVNIYYLIQHNFICNIIQKESNDKKQFVINEIKIFFNDFFHDKKNREIIFDIQFDKFDRLNNILVEFALYYNNDFYKKISRKEIDNVELNNLFENYSDILKYIFSIFKKSIEKNNKEESSDNGDLEKKIKLKIYNFRNTFEKLLEKDINLFFDLIAIYHHELTNCKDYNMKIFILAIKLNPRKFFNKLKEIQSNKNSKFNSAYLEIDEYLDKKYLIEYILNNTDYDLYSNLECVNNSKLFSNKENAIYLLNYINKKEASLFVYKKIEKLSLNKNNIEKFIEFINYTINNNFVYDYLLSQLSNNELGEVISTNKNYQKIIISSLFKYSSINSYYILKDLLNKLYSYISKDEFLSIVYNARQEPIISPSEYNIELFNIKEDKNIYLLSYSLSVKLVPNYESIAVILNHCKFPEGIIKIMEFLNIGINLNFSHFRCFNFFSGIKNEKRIKNLEINFYNLIILYKQILNNNNILIKFTDMEKFIFNNIIKIFILDLTPRELMLLTEENISENRVKNIKNDENKLFILLALFELKGMTILPIKKYFPSFYSKIEQFFIKTKSMININQICLKQNSDIKLYEKLKLFIQENNCNYIIEHFPLFKNLLTIFLLEKNDDLSLNLHKEKLTTIHKLILDLITNNNIIPFYDNNTSDDFFESIYSINDAIIECDIMNSHKLFIDSLYNFYQTSDIIIQKNDEQKEKYKWKYKNNELNVYESYLNIISNICRYVIFASDENKNMYNVNYYIEELYDEKEQRINDLKNSINLNEIIIKIIHIMENAYENNEFATCIKNWINNYLKNNSALQNLSKEKPKNILSYFKYLNTSCFILLKIINQLNNLKTVKENIDRIFFEKPSKININYYYNSNKEFVKKKTKETLFNLGKSILKEIENKKKLNEDDYYDIQENVQANISIYYYFNEEKEAFVESYTDIDFIKYINEKTNLIFDFININDVNDIIFIKESIDENKFNSILDELCFTMIYKLDSNKKDGTLQIFNSFLSQNKDFICKYLESTAFDLNQPNFDYYKFLILEKMRQVIFNYIYPCVSLNKILFKICENNYFENYIDFTELINSIKETRYHQDDNLNSSFQLQAIHFLIFGNSNLNLFILDLYNKICKKSRKKHINEIKDCFKIKLDLEGKKNLEEIKSKKSENSDINSIISNSSLTGKKLKLKSNPNFINSNKKMFFSIVSINPAKKNKIPIINCACYTPNSINVVGKSIGMIQKKAFQSILVKKPSDFILKKIENITPIYQYNNIPKKFRKKYTIIYEYLFSIKYVDKEKFIHISKNDISEILKNYSSKEEFSNLLNRFGVIEKKWKIDFDLDNIKIKYKFP